MDFVWCMLNKIATKMAAVLTIFICGHYSYVIYHLFSSKFHLCTTFIHISKSNIGFVLWTFYKFVICCSWDQQFKDYWNALLKCPNNHFLFNRESLWFHRWLTKKLRENSRLTDHLTGSRTPYPGRPRTSHRWEMRSSTSGRDMNSMLEL